MPLYEVYLIYGRAGKNKKEAVPLTDTPVSRKRSHEIRLLVYKKKALFLRAINASSAQKAIDDT